MLLISQEEEEQIFWCEQPLSAKQKVDYLGEVFWVKDNLEDLVEDSFKLLC